MRNLILFFTIAMFTLLTSCGPEKGATKKANPKAKTTQTKKGKKNNKTANAKATAKTASSKVKLNADQKAKIAKIEANYEKRINYLRKKKEWTGEKNAKTRKALNADKAKELKAVLGGKYKDYIASQMKPKNKKK